MTRRTLLVAISGGVDSVVLLDMLARGEDRLLVAHVDHGIREESPEDARFVEGLAHTYGLPFVSTQLALGPNAGEDVARQARYAFLEGEAATHKAEIVTAHHLDDVIGSVAINVIRGTGWRGLAVMSRPGIIRPLLGWTKRQIYDYALERRLEWVEDSTNQSNAYLRNRLRGSIVRLPAGTKNRLAQLRSQQQILSRDIDRMCDRLLERHAGSRYFYTMIEPVAAIELLRREIEAATGVRPTIAHAIRTLQVIKTGRAGSRCDVSDGIRVTVARTTFVVARHLR